MRFSFLHYYIYLNIILGCEGPPGKTGERGEHIIICTVSRRIHAKFIRKKAYICYNQNKRKDYSCCFCLCCSTAIHNFLFRSMTFVDNIFFLKFQVLRVPKENPVLPVSQHKINFIRIFKATK